jgi:hypothetical protein
MRATRLFVVLFILTGSMISVVPRAAAASITQCGTTVYSDVTLKFDLSCVNVSGVIVGAEGITIDLNGHKLTGDRTSNRYGIENTGSFFDVTVKNGTLSNFDLGIYVDGGDPTYGFTNGMTVRDVAAVNNTNSGIWIFGAFARVISSEVSSNDGGAGIEIYGDTAKVEFSNVFDNGFSGIFIDGDYARVASSRIKRNGQDGVFIRGALPVVTSSIASFNARDGIYIEGGAARVRASKASRNGNDGVEVSGNAAKIGRLSGGPSSDKNQADNNGFDDGLPDLGQGYFVRDFATTAPIGRNEANGNDDPAECNPATLC